MTEQDRELAVKRLQRQTGSNDPELLAGYLRDAEDTVLDLIGRDVLPERLFSAVIALAEVFYSRRGLEGVSSHTEGSVSQTYLDGLPAPIRERLVHYPRKARVVGNAPKS